MKRAERRELGAAVEEFRSWVGLAEQIRHMAAHMPLSGATELPPRADVIVRPLLQLHSSGDLDRAGELTTTVFFDGRQKLKPAHEAATRVMALRQHYLRTWGQHGVLGLHREFSERIQGERRDLQELLVLLDGLDLQAKQILHDTAHLPLTRAGALSLSERTAAESIIEAMREHRSTAAALSDGAVCSRGWCAEPHRAVVALQQFRQAATQLGTIEEIQSAVLRISQQLVTERRQVGDFDHQAKAWAGRIFAIKETRQQAAEIVRERTSELTREAIPARIDGTSVRLLLLGDEDQQLAGSLAVLSTVLTEADQKVLDDSLAAARTIMETIYSGFQSDWSCRGNGRCARAHKLIPDLYRQREEIERALLNVPAALALEIGELDRLGDPALGFVQHLPANSCPPELLPADLTERAKEHVSTIVHVVDETKAAAKKAQDAAEAVRAADVVTGLQAMDLQTLRQASTEPIRVGPLENQGLHNVWEVLEFSRAHQQLTAVPGLGESSARGIMQAALRLREAVREDTPVRIDVRVRADRTTRLLECLRTWGALRSFDASEDEAALARALMEAFKTNGAVRRILAVAESAQGVHPPVLADLLASALDRIVPPREGTDIWTDFLSRPAEYSAMLNELGFMTEDEKKMHGDLPEEIVEAVRAKELRLDLFTGSLRAYQSFGARFALVQERIVIGDEMGLGKTVEALAVLAHLSETGQTHSLVVCPAAVVSNWIREVRKHTKLRAWRLHGAYWERNREAKSWLRAGGIAVTTYDLLPWARSLLPEETVTCAVFDEAHYIKNPKAKRSQAAAAVMDLVRYTMLMTGTPLENNVQEFRNLIGYIRRDLADSAPEYLASRFRRHVAPAYLRRNQEDVLTELPELIETDEWLGLSADDEARYNDAVAGGNFMLMRRAAMLSPRSQKMERLAEIVEEAKGSGRKVIVFSYFREVLSEIRASLFGEVFGPLTGSVPAGDRQSLIDYFSEASDGAVLLAQITAGGIGLNIQSCSVVVICEPQLKPTMESQAIARAHRMGQTNTVQVHRLLTENSVDERIIDILATKRHLFDDFARDSVIAEQAPDAVDVSDAELGRMVVAAERERLRGLDKIMQPSPSPAL